MAPPKRVLSRIVFTVRAHKNKHVLAAKKNPNKENWNIFDSLRSSTGQLRMLLVLWLPERLGNKAPKNTTAAMPPAGLIRNVNRA